LKRNKLGIFEQSSQPIIELYGFHNLNQIVGPVYCKKIHEFGLQVAPGEGARGLQQLLVEAHHRQVGEVHPLRVRRFQVSVRKRNLQKKGSINQSVFFGKLQMKKQIFAH
jgi:hypothetical protein